MWWLVCGVSVVSMCSCGYGWSQAVRDARKTKLEARQKALRYLVDYIARTTGTKGDLRRRRGAIKALGETRLPRAIGALRMVLMHETLSPLRQDAIRALSALRAHSALQELREALLQDKDLDVRMLAAAALGQVGDRRALRDLLDALKDPQPAVRVAAIRALARLHVKETIPALIDRLCDGHVDVREAASSALLKMKRAALPWLMKELDVRNPQRRHCVVSFFPKMKSFALLPLLRAFAVKEKRAAATQALERLTGDTKSWPVFQKILERPRTYDGRKDLDSLKRDGTLSTIHAAFALWYEVPVRYRLRYRDVLGVIARRFPGEGLALLKRHAEKGLDLAYRSTAVIALGDVGPPALPVLRRFLRSGQRALVISAIIGLGKVGPKGLSLLTPLLQSKDEHLRIFAVRSVGQIRSREAREMLLLLLQDKAAKIRIEALKGIAMQREKSMLPAVRKLLSDPVLDVVMTAIQTLLKLGDTRNAKLYIQALRRGPYPPRAEFVKTLGELGDRRAIPLLKKLVRRYLRDWKEYREQALRRYRQQLSLLKSVTKEKLRTLREQIRQQLKEHDAVNPEAICAFFEALRALLKFHFPVHQVISGQGYQFGGSFNPLSRQVDLCPWSTLQVNSSQ